MRTVKSFQQFVESVNTDAIESVNENLKAEYQEYFKEVLAKYKVNSPMKLSKEEKSKFFAEVKAGWVKGQGRKDKAKAE